MFFFVFFGCFLVLFCVFVFFLVFVCLSICLRVSLESGAFFGRLVGVGFVAWFSAVFWQFVLVYLVFEWLVRFWIVFCFVWSFLG